MLAVLCSLIANTSDDGEGKHFVYRKSTGGGTGTIAVPDQSMMRPEDFLPNYDGVSATREPDRKHLTDRGAEDFIEMLKSKFDAVDLRKQRRDAPRLG